MTHAIRVHATGGPEVLQWEAVEVGEPGPGQARIRHTAIGLNFIEVYHRIGFYPIPTPFTPGQEGAGVVEAVGAGVTHVKAGRPRRLWRHHRLLFRAPPDRRRQAPGAARRDRRPLGRRADVEGTDRGGPAAARIQGRRRPYRALSRRRRRRRHHRLPMGRGAWRNRDRHCRLGREGRIRARPRLPPCHQLPERRLCRRGSTRSPAAKASTWSTTRSARTPSPARSNA